MEGNFLDDTLNHLNTTLYTSIISCGNIQGSYHCSCSLSRVRLMFCN